MQPVDVILLSWNRQDDTIQTIENILEQRGVLPLIWIVDQGSDQACLEAIRDIAKHPQVSLYEAGRNLGIAGGRNQAMKMGEAAFIFSIDNDAVFNEPDTLFRIVQRFQSQPQLGAIGCRIINYYTGQYDRLSWVYPRQLFDRQHESFLTTRFAGGAHALRRTALKATHLYDEQLFFYWEELDLSNQLIEAGFNIIYEPDCVVCHKVNPDERVQWTNNRFYYLVRNALYLDYKYYRSSRRFIILASGYVVKGSFNAVPGQVFRGVTDAIKMIRRHGKTFPPPLSHRARDYIYQHELKYRGSFLTRVRREVFEKLPG